jgi:hypothetical protein
MQRLSGDPQADFLDRTRVFLGWAHALKGQSLTASGRRTEAEESLRQALMLIGPMKPPEEGDVGSVDQALCLACTSSLVRALRSEAQAHDKDEARLLEERAIGLLRRFSDQARKGLHPRRDQLYDRGMIRRSPSFDRLRDRPDFQELIQDLDFPTWPFAGDPPRVEPPVGEDRPGSATPEDSESIP